MRLNKFLNEGILDKGIFKAVFMGGIPGSGKTYTFSKIKSGQIEPRIVNTDKSFPLFKEYWNDDWGKINLKVKTITKNQLALYINSVLPLAIDGTANETSVVLKRNGLLESFGYDTAMLFVNTSLETAIKRAGLRERQVDIDFIKKVYEQSEKSKNFYRGRFSTFIEVNNDEGELNEKVILHAFKFMNKFYGSNIINPVGKEYKRRMMENGWKYLVPNIYTIEEIQQVLTSWYKR